MLDPVTDHQTDKHRWADGRKYWSLLIQTSRNLARTIWINTAEREGELGKEDLLAKLYAGVSYTTLNQRTDNI